MNIIGICQIYNEVESGNLERALSHYAKLCDKIIILDDVSTDCPENIIKKYTPHYLKNKHNNWSIQKETKNKSILLEHAKTLSADWVINFDADEIIENGFNRNILERVIKWGDSHNIYSFGFNWINLWLCEYLYRIDGGLSIISPPRIYKVLPDAEIKDIQGLHQRLWPEYADNPEIIPWHLLHYSSSSVDKLVYKIVRYCRLDKRFRNIEEAKQYYLYNLLNGVKVDYVNKEWFSCDINIRESSMLDNVLQLLHEEVIDRVEEQLK